MDYYVNRNIKVKNQYINAVLPFDKKYSYILLDEISELIIDLLEKGLNINEIALSIVDEYDANFDDVKRDVEEVVANLVEAGLVEASKSNLISKNEDIQEENIYNEINKIYFKNKAPFKVFLELTHNCNLRCKHCYIDEYNTDIISYEEACNIMDELHDNGVVELYVTGGEVGLHPNLEKIIKYASNFFVVTLLTNGTLLSEDTIKYLCKTKLYEVQISVYGMGKHHDRFVNKEGAWDKSIQSLKLFKKYGGIGKAAIVVNTDTVDSIEELKEFLDKENLNYIITPVINSSIWGDDRPHKYRLNSEQLKDFFIKNIVTIGGTICTAGISRFRIAPNKNVYPCEMLENIYLGNLADNKFIKILNSKHRKKWINYYSQWKGDKKCIDCEEKNTCISCIGMNYIENKNYNIKNNYACLISKIQSKIRSQ